MMRAAILREYLLLAKLNVVSLGVQQFILCGAGCVGWDGRIAIHFGAFMLKSDMLLFLMPIQKASALIRI